MAKIARTIRTTTSSPQDSQGSAEPPAKLSPKLSRPAGRKLFSDEQMKQFLAQGDIRSAADAQEALKDLFGHQLI